MSTLVRLMALRRGTYYTTGETSGTTTPNPTPTLPLDPDSLVENTDYGVVKVQGGKLVLDMQDFDADLGRF